MGLAFGVVRPHSDQAWNVIVQVRYGFAIQAHSELRPLVNDNGIHYGEQIKNYARYHSQDTDVFQPMYPCEKIMKQYYTS